MKKLAAALLSAALTLSAASAAAYAEDNPSEKTTKVDGVTYTYTIGDSDPAVITIMSVTGAEGEYTLPDTIDGHKVTDIYDRAFLGQTKLESITLPNDISRIGSSAFAGCTSLTRFVIPDSVNVIGDSAFMGCNRLGSVTVGKNVKDIPDDCFFACTSLTEVVLPEKLRSIGSEAFFGCPELEITVPASVTSIGFAAIGWEADAHSSGITNISGFLIYGKTGSRAEEYAADNDIDFLDPDNYLAGDVNADTKVDAKDASAVLAEYARASTGAALTFTKRQRIVGDIVPDETINSKDASKILIEYARLSTL